jgi:hypothetical protein
LAFSRQADLRFTLMILSAKPKPHGYNKTGPIGDHRI